MIVKITGPDQVDTKSAQLSKAAKTPIQWQNMTSVDYTWTCDACTSSNTSILQDNQGNGIVGPLTVPAQGQPIGPFFPSPYAQNSTYAYHVQPAGTQREPGGVGDDPPDMQISN